MSFAATGDARVLAAALRELPAYVDPGGGVTPSRIIAALAVGDYPGAYAALAASPLPAFQDVDFSFYYPRTWYEAQIARAAGDEARARTAFAACRKVLEERPTAPTGEPRTLAVLAQVDAGLGNRELAWPRPGARSNSCRSRAMPTAARWSCKVSRRSRPGPGTKPARWTPSKRWSGCPLSDLRLPAKRPDVGTAPWRPAFRGAGGFPRAEAVRQKGLSPRRARDTLFVRPFYPNSPP